METNTPYLRLGIFVVAGLLILLLGIFLISSRRYTFAHSFQVEATFNNAAGLKQGAPVTVSGVEKGVIKKLIMPDQPTGKVRVIMKLDGDAQKLIGPDAVAHIKSQGFFGEKYVEIEVREEQAVPTTETGKARHYIVIRGEEAEDIDKLVTQATKTVGALQDAAEQFRDFGHKLNSKEGSLGQLIGDKELYQNVSTTVKSLQTSSAKLQDVVNHVRSGQGTLGNLVYGRELTPEISATIADARQSTQKLSTLLNDLQSGKGTMGMLLQDEEMAADLRATLKSGRAAAENLERMLSGIENGEGPLGALVGGNSKTQGNFGATLKEAHSAVVQMNEVLTAVKTNSLLRGYFQDRGYWSAADIAENQLDEPVTGKLVKEYSFPTSELFGKKNYSAKLKKIDPLYPIGVYLMNQSYSIVAIRVYLSDVGKAEENLELSQARAFVIREYLAKNFPLDEKKLKIKGYGESNDLPIPQELGAGLIRISVYE